MPDQLTGPALDRAEVWSCGGGTQSGAIAALIGCGKLPRPDIAFMVDTGRERSGTWVFVEEFIRPHLAKVQLPLAIVKTADFASIDVVVDGSVLIPAFTNINGRVSKLSPFCSGTWKRDVSERWLRSIGIKSARCWIGISIDEIRRLRNKHRAWLDLWYPLILNSSTRMNRSRCVQEIRAWGYKGEIPHSACWACPNASDAEWMDMKANWLISGWRVNWESRSRPKILTRGCTRPVFRSIRWYSAISKHCLTRNALEGVLHE